MKRILFLFIAAMLSFAAGTQTALWAEEELPAITLTIDPSKSYQTIRDFGASDCWTAELVGDCFLTSVKKKATRWLFSKETDRSGNPLEKSTWISEMQNADRSLYAAIQIINQFNEIDYSLKINTKTTMLTDYDNEVQLSLLLIENNIMQPQKFSDHVDTFYIHDHVLRYGINGTYGEYISPNGLVSKDSSYLYGYTVDFNGHDWWPDACRVVAILLDRDTKKVLQVEEALVK